MKISGKWLGNLMTPSAALLVAVIMLTPFGVNAAAQESGNDKIATANQPCPPSGSPADIATVALIQKKPALSRDDFRSYWRDVHGILAVRIPGFWTYTQYHLGDEILAANHHGTGEAVATELIHGFAEVTYCTEADIAGLASSTVTGLIKEDEQNAFAATYLYGTERGDSTTRVARRAAPSPVSLDNGATVIILAAKAAGEQPAVFRSAVDKALASLSQRCTGVHWIRSHYFAPYQPDAWEAPQVNHNPTVVYDAALELTFANGTAAQACLSDAVLEPLRSGEPERTVTVYPVSARYQMVRDGQPTQLGLRGLPAWQLIQDLNARNQMSPAILNVLYGAGDE